MTDTNIPKPSEEEVIEPNSDPPIEKAEPLEVPPQVERGLEEELRSMGISIVREDGEHKVGNTTRYLVVGSKGTEEDDPKIEAMGDSRINALKALKVRLLSS